jgi:hypothetical protein
MNIYFDCEFTCLQKNTTLIIIGFITETNETFYAELTDYDVDMVDDWINENVISKLKLGKFDIDRDYEPYDKNVIFRGNLNEMKFALSHWLDKYENIEIWSDCLSYDWVLFCDIFGGALKIPKNIYYIPFDLSSLFKIKGIDPDISREEFSGVNGKNKHNSLFDAKVIKLCYEKLIK